jgi:hypothetical protein
LERSFGAENVNKVFPDSPPFPSDGVRTLMSLLLLLLFSIFIKWKQFVLICQSISMFAMKERRKKANSALCSIFQWPFQCSSFWVHFCSCGRDLSAHWMYSTVHNHNRSSSVLPPPEQTPYSHIDCASTNSQRGAPSNDHNNTKRHEH